MLPKGCILRGCVIKFLKQNSRQECCCDALRKEKNYSVALSGPISLVQSFWLMF